MLYLIGGAARTGKTILAKRLLDEKNIPYFCIDYLVSSIDRKMHDEPSKKVAHKVWPNIKFLLRNIVEVEPNYVIEGDKFLPEFVSQIINEYPNKITPCFLGYSSISPKQKIKEIKQNKNTINNWTENLSDRDLMELTNEMIDYSKFLKKECKKYDIPYFDLSDDFLKTLEQTYKYLIK